MQFIKVWTLVDNDVLSSELLALIMWEVEKERRFCKKLFSCKEEIEDFLSSTVFLRFSRCNLWSNQSYCMCPVVTSEICLDLSQVSWVIWKKYETKKNGGDSWDAEESQRTRTLYPNKGKKVYFVR